MKSGIYGSKYFIAISAFVLLVFTGIATVLRGKFNARTEQISKDIGSQTFQLKSLALREEFNSILKGLYTAEELAIQTRGIASTDQILPGLTKLLTGGAAIGDAWYVEIKDRDTLVKSIDKATQGIKPAHPDLRAWVLTQARNKKSKDPNGSLVRIAGSLHWIEPSAYHFQGSGTIFFGIDINLTDLQKHLWNVNEKGRATATIIDSSGYYISNPEEELVGTRVPDSLMRLSGEVRLADSLSSYETIYSSFLQVPVIRYYTPFRVGSMNWTMVVDTPLFVVIEDTQAIERYAMLIFVASALIILLLIALAQAKWQKEFMLRQEAEMTKQRLSLEKQALMLTTERQKTENALLQLDKLKEKVDPHFLFNSLTSVNALIEEKPELAKSFVVKLSRVYRYVLDPPESGLAKLSQEMRFATEYFFLLQIRFGSSLLPLATEIRDEHQNALLPFMSIQILLENAVKHNIVSKASPLHIRIESLDNGIMVTNNLQLRQDQRASGKHGLKYLQKTFAFFGVSGFQYELTGDTFVCFLPFINSKDIPTP
ncbi:MAG: histidine kinase [Arcticibacter sp.]